MGFLIAGILLVLFEGLARVVATGEDDLLLARAGTQESSIPGMVLSPKMGWVLKPDFRGYAEESKRSFNHAGYISVDSEQVANQETRKILFIGDSNTFGYGGSAENSFVEVADKLLPQAHTINLGVPEYSSYQRLLVARKYIPKLRPRVVVVSFNFNDRRAVTTSAFQQESSSHFQDLYGRQLSQRNKYWK